MRQTIKRGKGQQSVSEQIYDLLPEYKGKQFTSLDIHAQIPWVSMGAVSGAMHLLAHVHHTIVPVGKEGRTITYEVGDLDDVPEFKRGGGVGGKKGRTFKRDTGKGKEGNEGGQKRLTPYQARLQALSDQLVALAVEIEGLQLENIPDTDIAREYWKRKGPTKK